MRLSQKSKTVLISILFLFINVFASASVHAEDSAKEMSAKVLKQWHCPGAGKVQLEFKFKLTKSGDVYNLSLVKGFDDPFAIRSAVHALLFAMPYKYAEPEKSVFDCTISGDKASPSIVISSSAAPVQNEKEAISKIPSVEKYSSHTFLYGPMAVRLRALCVSLYDFPDSLELKGEIEKICSFMRLSTQKSHDWVCIARWSDHNLVIMRNPSKDINNEIRSTIASLLQAWKLKQDNAILLELEEAFNRSVAVEILNASKGDPLLLANAALLTNQIKFAAEQYHFAVREGKTEAKTLLELMKGSVVKSELKKIELREEYIPKRDSSSWLALLRWLPVDTESVAFEVVSPKAGEKSSSMSFFSNLTFESILNDGSMNKENPPHPLENGLLKGVSKTYCMLAARKFKDQSAGASDVASFLVFPEEFKQTGTNILGNLSKNCSNKQSVEGIEILCFSKDASYGSVSSCNYVCSPYEGVLLAVSSKQYLQEILLRLRNQPDDCALPQTNPEWKLVDTSADSWIVRHYDQSYVPFDNIGMYNLALTKADLRNLKSIPEDKGEEIGFTYHSKNSVVTVHQLSTNPNTLESLAGRWPYIFNYDMSGNQEKETSKKSDVKVSIKDNVLNVEGKANFRGILDLELIMDFGFFVNI